MSILTFLLLAYGKWRKLSSSSLIATILEIGVMLVITLCVVGGWFWNFQKWEGYPNWQVWNRGKVLTPVQTVILNRRVNTEKVFKFLDYLTTYTEILGTSLKRLKIIIFWKMPCWLPLLSWVQMSSSLGVQAFLWGENKYHCTFKLLVARTPNCAIPWVLQGYGGR